MTDYEVAEKAYFVEREHLKIKGCYTGATRLSSKIIDAQVAGYVERKEQVESALDQMKALTIEMKNALLLGQHGSRDAEPCCLRLDR